MAPVNLFKIIAKDDHGVIYNPIYNTMLVYFSL